MKPGNGIRAVLLAVSCVFAATDAITQDRPVFEFERPPSSNVIDLDLPPNADGAIGRHDDQEIDIRRDIAWQLSVTGDWNYDLEGVGSVRTGMGGDRSTDSLIIATLELEGEEPPLTLSVLNAGGSELGHVSFSQTGTPRSDAAFYSLGTNYLTPEGRQPRSIGAAENGGFLLNDYGFVRFDRRNDGTVMHFTIDVILCESKEPEPPDAPRTGFTGWDFTAPPSLPEPETPCDRLFPGDIPTASATVTGCIAETNQFVAGACELPFQIDSVTPHDQRENVNYRDPEITVTFSEPAAIDSLNENFVLFTRARDGEPLLVEGDWRQGNGPSTYRFRPNGGFDIRSGLIMEARVESGLDGVRSRDGEKWLDEDEVWHFSTLLNMADDDNPQNFDVDLQTFQVVRDAPLTRGKPTLSRVYLDWDLHDDIAEEWQPQSYPVRFELSPDHPRMVGQFGLTPRHRNVARIYREVEFSAENLRFAHHTVNFFGWEPDEQSTASMRLEMSHHDPFPSPSAQDEGLWQGEADIWNHDPAPHGLAFSLALVGSWSDGVPPTVLSRINSGLNNLAMTIPQFFPYRDAQVWPAGFHLASATLVDNVPDEDARLIQLLQHVIADARLNASIAPNDTYIVFVPPDFMDAAGRAFGASARSQGNALNSIVSVPGMRIMVVVATDEDWFDSQTMTQAMLHELGHEHGLRHNPGNVGPGLPEGSHPMWDFGIEAWRMDSHGLSGANKSSTEGNAQHPDAMASMMWPWAIRMNEMSVTASEYRSLMASIYMGTEATPFDFGSLGSQLPYLVASGPETVVSDARIPPPETLIVSGAIGPNGTSARIEEFHLVEAHPDVDPGGPFRAQLRTDNGSVISEVRFTPEERPRLLPRAGHDLASDDVAFPETLPGGQFLVALPHDLRASTVVILAGDTELARYDAPPERPVFSVLPDILHENEDELLVGWRMAEGQNISFSVEYSSTGHAPWHSLYSRLPMNEAAIPRAFLPPGPRPTLRVTARDGFYFTRRELALEPPEPSGPDIIALPTAAAFAEGEPLTLAFATSMRPEALQEYIRINDATGRPVETDIHYNSASGQVSVFVPFVLEQQEELELEVDPMLADIHGSLIGTELRLPLP